ncbi:hypothetical protein Rcae01_03874 [Novipirellula caenicola]|uniref:Uncharacterized protein n=1 Tax=Novipirellula caenicola TaxID=1536901 RepID=A0ABP9VTB3_9BACT
MWAERIRGGRATLTLFWALDEVNGSFEGIVSRPRERLSPGSGVVFGVQSLTDPGTEHSDPGTGPGDRALARSYRAGRNYDTVQCLITISGRGKNGKSRSSSPAER